MNRGITFRDACQRCLPSMMTQVPSFGWDARPYKCKLNTQSIVVYMQDDLFHVIEFRTVEGAQGFVSKFWGCWVRFSVRGSQPKFMDCGGINVLPYIKDPVRQITAWTNEKVRVPSICGTLCACIQPDTILECLSGCFYSPASSNMRLRSKKGVQLR